MPFPQNVTSAMRDIEDHLIFLYGEEAGRRTWRRLRERLERFREARPVGAGPRGRGTSTYGRRVWKPALPDAAGGKRGPPDAAGSKAALRREGAADPDERLTERDAFLITYGDQVTEPGTAPLRTLAEVLESVLRSNGVRPITGLHLLPFFPYSSDDGFSVIDYTEVDPELGSWEDVERLGRSFRLMFDAVINHISRESAWFQGFRCGDGRHEDRFIVVDPDTDLSDVVRPRDQPLLTPVQTAGAPEVKTWVWTTFGPDQIDLNYANPDVLLDIVDVLLLYVEKGAEVIRLDAIAYIWKEVGTSCIHLEEAHRVVKLFRAVLDVAAPHVILITETNVPHEENVSYFGDGHDEAQMVYQFPLPPLVLHAFHSGSASRLARWAAELSTPSENTTFFNFLASHDGVGVRPAEGILTLSEIQALVDRTQAHGGYVSYKTNADGSKSVYELNISYFDALSDPHGDEPLELQVRRFLASQAIMLSLAGVPGIYVHSLFGSRSYHAGVEETGRYRSINRERFRRAELEQALADPGSLRHRVFSPYLDLLRVRGGHPAFHPGGGQRVLLPQETGNEALFALLRLPPGGGRGVLCLHNVAESEQGCHISVEDLEPGGGREWQDLISGEVHPVEDGRLTLLLEPYQVLWLDAKL